MVLAPSFSSLPGTDRKLPAPVTGYEALLASRWHAEPHGPAAGLAADTRGSHMTTFAKTASFLTIHGLQYHICCSRKRRLSLQPFVFPRVLSAQPLKTRIADLTHTVLEVPRKISVKILNEDVWSCSDQDTSWTTELLSPLITFYELNCGLKSCLQGCFPLTETHFFVQVLF